MTPEQRRMARHALGLIDGRKTSYRNRYYAHLGSEKGMAWDSLVEQELAEKIPTDASLTGYFLTLAGAKSVLEQDERLCGEDFPAAVGQSR
jgi:hypothetical protein